MARADGIREAHARREVVAIGWHLSRGCVKRIADQAGDFEGLQVMDWRAKPYGRQDSAYTLFKTVEQYRLGDLVKRIRTPIMVTDPEGEQFWPGQSQRLYAALPATKVLVPFTKAGGADMPCEPMARSLLEQRMFDWLDETLGTHG